MDFLLVKDFLDEAAILEHLVGGRVLSEITHK